MEAQTSPAVVTTAPVEFLPTTPERETTERGRAQTKEQKVRQALETKSIGLCMANYSGSSVSYVIHSLKAGKLFPISDDEGNEGATSSDQKSQFREVQFPWNDDDICFKMGCFKSGSKLYLLGGQNPLEESFSSRVYTLDLASNKPPYYEASEAPEMLSGKSSPLIVPVGEKLYVLTGMPVSMLPEYPFEAYDKEEDTWESLPPPPFLNPDDSLFFQDPKFLYHVVIDNKIHVSTSTFSFSFNTITNEWTPCTMFDDPIRRIRYPPNSGQPFDFEGGAIMYGGDVMIGLVPSRRIVVAYKLVDGKVEEKQVLEGLKIPRNVTFSHLADFGGGYLCMLCVLNNDLLKKDCQISITPFRVSNLEFESTQIGQMKKILNCSTGKRSSHTFKVPAPSTEQLPLGKFLSPIGCFVV